MIVSESVISNSYDWFRPLLYLPMVYGCANSYSTNYGTASLTSDLTFVGSVSNTSNSYSALATTFLFPNVTNPALSYAKVTTTNGAFSILNGPFTVSFVVRYFQNLFEIAPFSLLTSTTGSIVFLIRINLNVGEMFIWYGNGACSNNGAKLCALSQSYNMGEYLHVGLTYESGTLTWYLNGVFQSTCSQTISTTATP